MKHGWKMLFVLLLSATAGLGGATGRVRVLADFEDSVSLDGWRGPLGLSAAHPSHGKGCVQVDFKSSDDTISLPVQEGDWSPYERLLFDVFSGEAQPRILTFTLFDAVGGDGADADRFDRYWGDEKLFVGSGWTHVEVMLTSLNASSELRRIALDRVRRVSISSDPGARSLTLYFDNFRLLAGNEGTATASAVAPPDTTTRLEGRWVTIGQVGPRGRIPESDAVKRLRDQAQRERARLIEAVQSAELTGLDAIYSQVDLAVADMGLTLRPLLPWFNNDREKGRLFRYVSESCRRERERLEALISGGLRMPDRDDTQIAGPLVPPLPQLHGLPSLDGFFRDPDGRPLFVISVHGPSEALQRFFATPMQHIESYSVGGGSRWTLDNSPVYEAFRKYPDARRVGWDGWCGHLIRDLDSMGGKKENTVICLESPQIREAVERYIEREWKQWLRNPNLLYNIMAYELQYICYCERSQQMFRAWLEKKHGTVAALNGIWGTHFAAFSEIAAPPTKNARPLPGTNRAQWYDWACFNQDRFSDYLVWVKSVIRRFDSVTPLAAGGSSSMLYGGNGTSGIDEEQIVNRVDDVIIHEGSGSTLGMDLQLALAESPKPLCDPEMNLEEVRYLLPHMLHGKSVIQIWHWPDQPPREYPRLINDSPAHGWKFALPDVAALLRAALDARRLSREIASFAFAPAQVAILYSRTSMLQVPPEMLTWRTTPYLRELENAYEAGRFLDTRTTFVTERQILRGDLSRYRVLLVPAASHMRADVVRAINSFVENSGSLLVLPSSFVSDEYNRHADYLDGMGVQVKRIEQITADRTGEIEHGYDQTFHDRVIYRPEVRQRLSTRPVGLFAADAPRIEAEGTRQEISLSSSFEVLAAFPDNGPALVSATRGRGRLYYSATGFARQSLNVLLDRLLDAAGVSRPVRIRRQDGEWPWNIESRSVDAEAGRLVYMVNFNDQPVDVRVELNGKVHLRAYDLRRQEMLRGGIIRLPAGDTVILRLE
jgi:hypothetical protein